jgi:hypothetical protein
MTGHDPNDLLCDAAPCICIRLRKARRDALASADARLRDYEATLTSARYRDIVTAARVLVSVTP